MSVSRSSHKPARGPGNTMRTSHLRSLIAFTAVVRNLPATSHRIHEIHVRYLSSVPNDSWLKSHGFGLERSLAEPHPP